MNLPALGEKSAVRITMLDDTTAAKRFVQRWVGVKEVNIEAGV